MGSTDDGPGAIHDNVLDAFGLPVRSAILDDSGVVVATNGEWRTFVERHAPGIAGVASGEDYLGTLDRDSHSRAERVRNGIRALLSGERERFELSYHFTSEQGSRWFRLVAGTHEIDGRRYVKVIHLDVTEQKRQERRLQRERARQERLIQRAPFPIFTYDKEGSIRDANDATAELFGVDAPPVLRGQPVEDFVHPDDRDAVHDQMSRVLGGGAVFPETHTVVGDDGARRAVMWAGVPFVRADETRVMVFGSDVTEQRYRERSYQRLHEGSQALLRANTLAEVTEEIVAIAEDLFEVSYVIAFRFDRSERLLQPVGATGTGSIAVENRLEPVEPGDGIVGETFVESEPRTVETGAVPRGVSNELPDSERIRVVPLSGEGVLVVGFAGRDSFDEDTITIIEGLGNIGAMAMANLRRTSHLQAAEEERDELQRTIQHLTNVTELFSDLWAAFAKSETRTEIERNTCEVLVNGPAVSGAWFGERNATTDSIEATVTTGVASSITDHVDYSLAVEYPTIPAVRALRESEPVVQRIDETPRGERMNEWARRLQATDVGLVYSTPIRSDDVTYGVVTFYVNRAHPAPRLLDLVADRGGFLGDMVANAITAVERKRSLASDKRFELTFRVSGPECLFSELADVLEAQVTFEKLVQQTGNTTVFVTIDDADPVAVRALPAEIGWIHEAEVLRERPTGETMARIDITRPFLGTLLSKWGASVSEITTRGSSVQVVATVPKNDLVSLIRTSLRDHFSSAELVSKRRVDDSEATNEPERFGNELTERQLEVLQTAYHAGYFESPRATTGEAVAELLDISPQAFYQHVRKIERKLAESVIESGVG